MALTRPFFSLERLTLATPTFSESSFRDIYRSAMTRSRRKMMGMVTSLQGLVGKLLELLAMVEDHGKAGQHTGDDEPDRF